VFTLIFMELVLLVFATMRSNIALMAFGMWHPQLFYQYKKQSSYLVTS
jgi:hypothetical protein